MCFLSLYLWPSTLINFLDFHKLKHLELVKVFDTTKSRLKNMPFSMCPTVSVSLAFQAWKNTNDHGQSES